MMKLGTETGSLINHIYSSSAPPANINVGDGVTILHWTDRSVGTVVEVFRNKAGEIIEVIVKGDNVERMDRNGLSECQSYYYSPNPNAHPTSIKPVSRGNAKGQWRVGGKKGGYSVVFGVRDYYRDPSF